MQTTTAISCRTAPDAGFTLIEMMVVLVVIGVLVAMAVPSFQLATEQSYADFAGANLRAIWAAQRLYWLENHAYAADLASLQALGLLDPAIVLSTGKYTYSVTAAESNSFQAVAVRSGSTRFMGQYTIDETGEITGAVQASGVHDIVPGFQ